MKKSKLSQFSHLQIGTVLAIAVMGTTGLGSRALAANLEKDNVGTDLSLGPTWVLQNAPGTGDVGLFDSVDQTQLALTFGASVSWGGIQVTNPGGALSFAAGNLLTLGGFGINSSTATQNLTMAQGIALAANQTWSSNTTGNIIDNGTVGLSTFSLVVNGSGVTTFGGIVSGTGNLAEFGTGTLNLNAANTFTTGVTLNGGQLDIGNAAGFGAAAGRLTINGGKIDNDSAAALTATNVYTMAGSWTYVGAAQNLTLSGAGSLTAPVTVTVSGHSLVLSGVIGGGAGNSLTKAGTGTMVLSGTNTFTGGLNINGGVVSIGAANNAGANANIVTFGGGSLAITAAATYAQPFAFNGTGAMTFLNTGNSNFTGNFSGAGTFNINSTAQAATVSFNAAAAGQFAAFSGTINFGTSVGFVRFQTANDHNASAVAINLGTPSGGGSLELFNRDGSDQQIGALSGGVGTYLDGLSNGSAPMSYQIGALNTATTMAGIIQNRPAGTQALGIRKVGTGTFTMTNASNAYTYVTEVQNGVLEFANAGALGTATNAAGNLIIGNSANPSANLRYVGTSAASVNRLMTFTNVAILGSTGTAPVTYSAVGDDVSTNGGSTTLTLQGTNTGLNTLTSNFTGGSLVKSGTGTWVMAGTGGTFSGGTTVNAGALLVNTATNNAIGTGPVNVAGGTFGGVGGDTTMGQVTVSSGAHLAPGLPGVNSGVGTLNTMGLTLNSGSVLDFDFSGVANDTVNVLNGSALSIGSAMTLNLFKNGTAVPFNSNGTYTLFTGLPGSIAGALPNGSGNLVGGNFSIGDTVGATNYVLTNTLNSSTLVLVISNGAGLSLANWQGDGNGNWAAGNPGFDTTAPGAVGTVNFGNVVTATRTVSLQGNQSIGAVVFNTTAGYTIVPGSGGTLTMDNGGVNASITNTQGVDTINAPVQLLAGIDIGVASNTLTINGAITGVGPVHAFGAGLLVMGGANSYGNTNIDAGATVQVGDGLGAASLGGGTTTSAGTVIINSAAVVNNLVSTGTITLNAGGSLTGTSSSTTAVVSTDATILGTFANAVSLQLAGTGIGNIGAAISGAGSVIQTSTGTTTLSGNNTYTGVTTVTSGKMILTGAITSSATSQIIIADQPSSIASMVINGGTLTALRTTVPSLSVGAGTGAMGLLVLNSGFINTTSEFHLGNTGQSSNGSFDMNGGTVTSGSYFVVGTEGDHTSMNQTGGVVNITTNLLTIAAGGADSVDVVNMSGGTVNSTAGNGGNGYYVGETGSGVLNLSGSALINTGAQNTILGRTGATPVGVFNLNGGTFKTHQVSQGIAGGKGYINFNGGTLTATAANTTFMTGLTNAVVWNGNANIDTGGFAITIGQALVAPTGLGLQSVGVFAGGSGYLDAPVLQVLSADGNGSGATAVANLTNGVVTSVTITNPGTGYTSPPNINILGGGGTGASLNTAVLNAGNSSIGGLNLFSAGTTTLSAVNTYNGPTNLNAGGLRVNGSLTGTGQVNMAASTSLGGTGSIAGNVVAGDGTSFNLVDGTLGTLTLGGSLTINNPTTAASFKFELGASGADELSIAGKLSLGAAGGSFGFTDLGVATGNTYTLLSYASGSSVAGLTGGAFPLGFNTATVTVNPTSVTVVVSGGAIPVNAFWTGSQGTNWNANNANLANFNTDATSNINLAELPLSTTNVIFSAATTGITNLTTTLGQNFDINSLQVQGALGLVTINAGSTLKIEGGGITVDPTSAGLTIAAPVTVATAQTWTGGSTTSPLTANGVITATAALTVGGQIVFGTQTNTFTGGIVIGPGLLNIPDSAGINSGTIIAGGGTLGINNTTAQTIANAISVPAGTIVFITDIGTGINHAFTGNITGSGTYGFVGASNQQISEDATGQFSGFTGVFVINTGFIRLQGSFDHGLIGTSMVLNTGGGIVNRDGGTDSLGSLTGDATTRLVGATSSTAVSTYSIGAKESSSFGGAIQTGYASNIVQKLSLTKVGATTLTLSGTASNYAGVTDITGGVLAISNIANGGIITTAASTATNTITVGSTTGMAVGMQIQGASVAPDDTITAINGTTVTLSANATTTNAAIVDLTYGTGNALGIAPNAAANLIIDGGTLRYTGPAASSDRLFTIGATSATLESSGSGALNLNNTGALAVAGGARTLTLGGTNTGNNILAAAIPDAATTLAKVGTGNWTITGANTFGSGVSVAGGKLTLGGNGTLPAGSTVTLTGGTLALSPGMQAIALSSLAISGTPTAPTASLDVGNSGLAVSYPDTPTGAALAVSMYQQVIAARGVQDINTGLSPYPGLGITSSTAAFNNANVAGFDQFGVGLINNADLANIGLNSPYSTFLGTPVTTNSVLARYTYMGDINLDGKINIDDYNYIDAGFEGELAGFTGQIIGDFNNDGKVNIDDYNVIDAGFGFQGSPLSDGGLTALGGPAVGISAVPEPASLVLLGLGAAGLLARRRRR